MTAPASNSPDRGPEVVARARAWIGTPYRHQASCRGAGTDCLGLLRGLWREMLGPEPEAVPAYTPDWSEPSRSEDLLAAAARHLVAVPLGERRPGDVRCSGCATARWRSTSAILARLGARASDADPCLFRPRRRRVAADAGLVPADRRAFPLSREERLMATLLLSAAGSALGGALGGSVAGLGTAVLGKAIGRDARLGIDQRLLGTGSEPVETGRVERFRVMGSSEGAPLRAGLRPVPGGRAADLVEPLPRGRPRGGGRRQGRRRDDARVLAIRSASRSRSARARCSGSGGSGRTGIVLDQSGS